MKYAKYRCLTTSPSKVSHLVIPSHDDPVLVSLVGDTGVGQNNGNATCAYIVPFIWKVYIRDQTREIPIHHFLAQYASLLQLQQLASEEG
jgi:hypothetical protein